MSEERFIIVTGPKDFEDRKTIYKALSEILEKVGKFTMLGGDTAGTEAIAKEWAEVNDIEVKSFPINWKDTNVEGAVVKTGPYGEYNAQAGMIRIRAIIEEGTHLVAFWDTKDVSTDIMISFANRACLKTIIFLVKGGDVKKIKHDEMDSHRAVVPSKSHSESKKTESPVPEAEEDDDIPF